MEIIAKRVSIQKRCRVKEHLRIFREAFQQSIGTRFRELIVGIVFLVGVVICRLDKTASLDVGFVIARMKSYVLIVIRHDHLVKGIFCCSELLEVMRVIYYKSLRRQYVWQTSQ